MKQHIQSALIAACLATTATADTVPTHAQDLFFRTVTHEMGHALIREFDLPFLTSEEMIANDFATVFMGHCMPDRAIDVTRAFFQFEFYDNDQEGLYSDYLNGGRRAARAVCLLFGMDSDRCGAIAGEVGLDGDDAGRCADSAPEIARSWRRILTPLMRPDDARITETGVIAAPDSRYFDRLAFVDPVECRTM